ncbi:hypothetical protein EKO04_004152 [Ascochyta lentis]|uniref:AA9 family lytic polysaccharide monooxygenase n=1 Tax=Ascochyta lentis TaxID=205686 RepID=A0A8H7J8S7_9PLEO|nr:hypothetical protein EKO04_004152 [Ascochyta lentis]
MKYSYAFAMAAAQLASAHTTFQSFVIDGKDQGHHFAVRTPSNGNNPILDVTSTAMICNGGTKAEDTLEVAAGSEISFQWHHSDPATVSGDADEPIAASHKGPIMVYIAPAESDGKGAVWTKLYEDGLTDGKWAIDKFISDKGLITITLPDLAAGDYLIRPEMIGLHEANREGGAQFYNGCGQIKVTGSGSASLPAEGVDMTKAYSASDPGVLFDMYSGATTYEMPGPKVWDGASGSGSATPSKTAAASSAAATSAAATSAAAPASSAAATSAAAEATPVQSEAATSAAATSAAATSAAAPAPSATQGSSSGSALPEEFTIQEFIAWLKETTGSTGASKTRRHARSFFG